MIQQLVEAKLARAGKSTERLESSQSPMDWRNRIGLYGAYFLGMAGIGFTLPYLPLDPPPTWHVR